MTSAAPCTPVWAVGGLPIDCMPAMLPQSLAAPQPLRSQSCVVGKNGAAGCRGVSQAHSQVLRHSTGMQARGFHAGWCPQVTGIAAAPQVSASTAASGSADGSVKLWAGSEGGGLRVLSTLRDHAGRVHSVGWGSGAHELVSASQVRVNSCCMHRRMQTKST